VQRRSEGRERERKGEKGLEVGEAEEGGQRKGEKGSATEK
jgi:hypothetical protein